MAGHRRQSVDLVVHSLNAVTQHHLSLAGLLNHRENTGQALNLLVLHCIVGHRSDTKAGCTVSNVRDVLGATQAVKNLLAKFAVIHDTSLDMRSMSTTCCYRRLRSPGTPERGNPEAGNTPENTKDPSLSTTGSTTLVPTMELRYSK